MKIAIAGCTGRMGLTLVKSVLAMPSIKLVAGSERPGYDIEQATAMLVREGACDLQILDNQAELAQSADAVIDFTAPEATLELAQAIAAKGGIHIIGTTGFSPEQQKTLETFGAKARIVQSGNFSLGVQVLAGLVRQAAKILGPEYDIEISEMHHRHKKDAPSGTALMLGHAAAEGRGMELHGHSISGRDGITGERPQGQIGFSALRGGDVVGIHDVYFAGPGEMLTLSHQGFSRDIYAAGALRAALWAKDKPAGFYSMQDVLGL